MIALAFTLLAGRYHATGWDHHVNEGTVEWPPSPWRLLRALVAASYRLGPDLDLKRFQALLERLTTPPEYYLPPVAPGHLRHYMPIEGSNTTKVFDAFLAVGRGVAEALPSAVSRPSTPSNPTAAAPDAITPSNPATAAPDDIIAAWPDLELTPADRDLLAQVAGQIAYLGRAESWAEARLCTELPDRRPDARPCTPGEDPPNQTRLLALLPAPNYELWQEGFLAAQDPQQRRKQALPATLWDRLNIDTGALQRAGWSTVPGTRWIPYAVAATPTKRPPRPTTARSDQPTFARLIFDGPVRPHVEKTLWIAERVRAALLYHVGDQPCPVLTGKDADDRPLQDHRHAYFLPQANDRGEVDHILIHARDGFDPLALHALRSLRVLHGLTSHPVHTTMVALGRAEALEHAPLPLRAATHWESLTPFVPPRCPKLRREQLIDTPEAQLRRLCGLVLGAEPIAIHPFTPEEARARRLHAYRRERRRGGLVPGYAMSLGFRLEFAEPIRGPIALGYGAHFGLGQFTPQDPPLPRQ